MQIDAYGFAHSSRAAAAVAHFEAAVAAVAGHRPAGADLGAALAIDPDMVAARALTGLAAVIMASAPAMTAARDQCRLSQTALARAPGGGTASERALVAALELAAGGDLNVAAARLELHLATAPHDFLAAKLAHALRFMSGEAGAMLAQTTALLPHWSEHMAGYGYLLGCHAFGLEETGSFSAAERFGRCAVAHTPHDVWGLHAVAHVLEMRDHVHDGIAWLAPTTALWSTCGNFGGHLAWHLALFQLSAGDHASALAVFDAHLKTSATCDFRDVANVTSLLWRLEQEGLDVGQRWDTVGAIADARRHDTTYVFGALHGLLALIGSRRLAAAADLVAALRSAADSGSTEQAAVSRSVGVALAEIILSMAENRRSAMPLAAVAARLGQLGGSVAQRDVFLRTLLLIAADSGDDVSLVRLKALRTSQRAEDRFVRIIEGRHGTRHGLKAIA